MNAFPFLVRFVAQVQTGIWILSVFIYGMVMSVLDIVIINYAWMVEVAVSLIFYFNVLSWQAKVYNFKKDTVIYY